MTIPYERLQAVAKTEQFLLELIDPNKTPRIPKDIRQRALYCLRHYPTKFDMEMAAEKAPDVFDTKFF